MKVTVLSEHRLMLRLLAMYYKKPMGDVLGDLIEPQWQIIRKGKMENRITKLLRQNTRVFLEHELLADEIIQFGMFESTDEASGFHAVLQSALARLKAILQHLRFPLYISFNDDVDCQDSDTMN